MKLIEALREANEEGCPYVAIDADGEMYGYRAKPTTLPNHSTWGFWSENQKIPASICIFLGKFEYVVENYEKCIFDINELRGVAL